MSDRKPVQTGQRRSAEPMSVTAADAPVGGSASKEATIINDNSSPVHIPHDLFRQLFGFEEFQAEGSHKHTAVSFNQVQRNFRITKAGRDSTLKSWYYPVREYFIGKYRNVTLQVWFAVLKLSGNDLIVAMHGTTGASMEGCSSKRSSVRHG